MTPPTPDGTMPGHDPRRPRIRPAQSENWDSAPPTRGHAPGGGTESGALPPSPHPAAAPTGYFTGPDGLQCFRSPDGAVFYQASDGRFYPISALDRAYSGASAGAAEPGSRTGSPVDGPTYYEYIAAHTGEQPAQPSTGPITGGQGTSGAAGIAGDPPSGRKSPRVLIATLAGVTVVALGLLLGGNFLGPDDGIRSTQLPSDGSQSGPADASAAADGTEGSAAPTVSAGEDLSAISESDTAEALERLDGRWVVQLSAKQDGLRTEGRTWSEEDILAEFEQNREAHPDAMLLWSGDWSTFRFNDYWITILGEAYDDPDEALAQCRALEIDRDHCFAKKLSTTEGPDESTKLNP